MVRGKERRKREKGEEKKGKRMREKGVHRLGLGGFGDDSNGEGKRKGGMRCAAGEGRCVRMGIVCGAFGTQRENMIGWKVRRWGERGIRCGGLSTDGENEEGAGTARVLG
ncbi:hypothetical protein GOBAR_AA08152 [Gossypium barbadense]|uniref:Uncharacterized protein n=1 Tax=Gossypium barbadense TaxID=3634 RepID=A0A2P5YA76_GOSBA|nr:hypothetical protein GOBAR_AA08152 [Gossypium barbadense]